MAPDLKPVLESIVAAAERSLGGDRLELNEVLEGICRKGREALEIPAPSGGKGPIAKYMIRIDVYRIVQERLERAIPTGLRRAWKHSELHGALDDREIDRVAECIENEIMLQLGEVIDWD